MQKHILRRPLLSSVVVSTRCNHNITASASASASSLLFNNNNNNIVINNNITKRSLYTPIPEDKKPKATESFPWRTYTIPSTYTTSNHSPHMKSMAADLHVATYNPMGKALKPPHPIILLPGLCTNHTIFSTLARELNYPYGLVAMNYHARAESKPQNLSKSTSSTKNRSEGGDSIKNHVYDLLRVLRSLDQTHAFVVGHGFGGFVGLLAMRMFPDRISGLVLLDSGFSAVHGGGGEESAPSATTSGAESSTTATATATTTTTPINTQNVKRSLPEHVLSGYAREVELLCDENISAEQLRQAIFGNDGSSDAVMNAVDAQDFATYSLENRDVAALRATAMIDLQSLPNTMLTVQELFKWRHPMNIVRAETGFPFDGLSQQALLDEKSAKELHSELNVKDKVFTLKGANHYTMLTGSQVSEVAKAIESLVCRYDIHWRINAEFESLKDETPQQRRERMEKIKKAEQQQQQQQQE